MISSRFASFRRGDRGRYPCCYCVTVTRSSFPRHLRNSHSKGQQLFAICNNCWLRFARVCVILSVCECCVFFCSCKQKPRRACVQWEKREGGRRKSKVKCRKDNEWAPKKCCEKIFIVPLVSECVVVLVLRRSKKLKKKKQQQHRKQIEKSLVCCCLGTHTNTQPAAGFCLCAWAVMLSSICLWSHTHTRKCTHAHAQSVVCYWNLHKIMLQQLLN